MVIAAAGVIRIIVLWSVLGHRASDAGTAAAPALRGQIKLRAEQLAPLGTQVLTATAFHDAVLAEGELAVNADTTTRVFSPYSAGVINVLAGVGDRVRRAA